MTYRERSDWVRWGIGIASTAVFAYMAWTTSTLMHIQSSTAASEAIRNTTNSTLKEEIGRLRGQLSDFRRLLDGLYRQDAAKAREKEVDTKFEKVETRLRALEIR